MANVVVMPQSGQTMEEGSVVEWKKAEGEIVDKGEILLEVETDKATIEVESDYSGVLEKILVEAGGDPVPCLTPIAIIADPGEEVNIEAVLAEFASENG